MSDQQRLVLLIFAIPFGLVVGSFLNVCIFRLPRNCMSIVRPRSRCISCLKMIAWYDNIPVFSWMILRGKCRNCGAAISARYPLVELLTCVLFFFVFFQELVLTQRAGVLPTVVWLAAKLYLVGALIVCTFIDFEWTILPDEITLSGVPLGLAASLAFPFLQTELAPTIRNAHLAALTTSALGALVGGGSIWLVGFLGKLVFRYPEVLGKAIVRSVRGSTLTVELTKGEVEPDMRIQVLRKDGVAFRGKIGALRKDGKDVERGARGDVCEVDVPNLGAVQTEQRVEFYIIHDTMGFGDVKFMAFIGAFLGWKAVLLTFVLACAFGSVVGIFIRLFTKNRYIPFGPFLSIGALTMLLFGGYVFQIIDWYLRSIQR